MFEKYLKNITGKIRAVSYYDPKKRVISPARDWQRLVVLFLVINVFIAISSAYFFYRINGDDTFIYENGKNAVAGSISRDKIEKAISYLKEKEAMENYLLLHRPDIADPSR